MGIPAAALEISAKPVSTRPMARVRGGSEEHLPALFSCERTAEKPGREGLTRHPLTIDHAANCGACGATLLGVHRRARWYVAHC